MQERRPPQRLQPMSFEQDTTLKQISKTPEIPKQQEERERKKEKLEPPPSHHSSMTHASYLSDEHFRSCYPPGARLTNTLKQAMRLNISTRSFVDELHEQDKQNSDAFIITDKMKSMIQDKIVRLKILNTSTLELDTNIMHPFVRIHFVDMTTGKYITKSQFDLNSVYNYESNCVNVMVDNARERKSCELEFVPPFATNCCDMRYTTNSRAVWNEEILVNESAEILCSPELLILFELLDFNALYLQAKKFDSLDCDYYYKIAWGYLRPLGLSNFHQGNLRIQLFKYIFNTRALNQSDRPECTPLVYFDFIWPNHVPYNGVLGIIYLMQDKPQEEEVQGNAVNVFEIEAGDRGLKDKFREQHEEQSEPEIQENLSDQDKINLRRRRFLGDKSQIPDKIAYKFSSAPLGCYRLVFNRKGNYLAAACTHKTSKTIIKIFDMEQGGNKFAQFRGHSNLVHDMNFSSSSAYLLTVSSDQTAKLWRIPRYSSEQVEEEESDHYLMAQLAHPSFVYSGLFLQDGVNPLVVTACFDSRIRVWRTDSKMNLVVQQEPLQWEVVSSTGNSFDNFSNILEHRHPNSLVFDGSRRLYAGDSLGGISVYDINSNTSSQVIATRINFIVNPEMNLDAINSLKLVPPEFKDLLVHSRDNCIRILEVNSSDSQYSEGGISTGSIASRFFGAISQKLNIRSVMSPCGEYILSGSEDGKPHLWDNMGIEQPTDQFQYDLMGPVTDVAWNETYHMVAISGFGDEHPIIIYTWERNEEMNFMEYKELQERLMNQHKKKDPEAEKIVSRPF